MLTEHLTADMTGIDGHVVKDVPLSTMAAKNDSSTSMHTAAKTPQSTHPFGLKPLVKLLT